jgi:hypothetical protein
MDERTKEPTNPPTNQPDYLYWDECFWEANISSANQEIPRILRNSMFHYHVQNSLSLIPILSHINPIHLMQ